MEIEWKIGMENFSPGVSGKRKLVTDLFIILNLWSISPLLGEGMYACQSVGEAGPHLHTMPRPLACVIPMDDRSNRVLGLVISW